MSTLPTVDLLTPCRNRVEYLRASLPSWLACAQIRRIVVVDFDSTTPVLDELGDLTGERVTVVRTENEPLWRQGRAQNVGLPLVDADLVLKIDADVSIVDLRPYVEALADNPKAFFKGYSKHGTSSGLCLAATQQMRALGGYHDHMSGWGGDDVDFCRRLGRRGCRRQFFRPESFQEQGQRMAGKNSEAPRLDSELLSGHDQLARNPFFTGFRNALLARIHPQNRRCALRWRYRRVQGDGGRVDARLRKARGWRLPLARHGTELANILALAHFERFDTPWELMRSDAFQQVVARHRLPRCRTKQDARDLLQELPQRTQALAGLAAELGINGCMPV
ncbi:glycosyltransferase family 2 protein [Cyanobium sp. CH-040]|uniref:glycosyltransferase family 2 protein n=1 Tax=Cyanobium sp. CH-040 TaxID=2823708 RepID=UPI0020CC7037|nr:glycosyltransferase family 2 protein [Cyanobium sp. CH-040]MCP9928016.1 glycosyltransferase family 2 protein [Cyanobium sp. CH-040]